MLEATVSCGNKPDNGRRRFSETHCLAEKLVIVAASSSNLPLHLCIESKKSSNDSIVTLDGEEIPNVAE